MQTSNRKNWSMYDTMRMLKYSENDKGTGFQTGPLEKCHEEDKWKVNRKFKNVIQFVRNGKKISLSRIPGILSDRIIQEEALPHVEHLYILFGKAAFGPLLALSREVLQEDSFQTE